MPRYQVRSKKLSCEQVCVEPVQVLVFREYTKYGGKCVVEVLEIAEGVDLSKLVTSIVKDHLIHEKRPFTSLGFSQTRAESNRFYTDFTEARPTIANATSLQG